MRFLSLMDFQNSSHFLEELHLQYPTPAPQVQETHFLQPIRRTPPQRSTTEPCEAAFVAQHH